jgi:hypothetical protein
MAVGEWDQRQLCPDGGCVGVIGPDGTCRVCGRAAPNWGDERKRGLIDPPDEDDQDGEADDDDELAASDGRNGDEYDEGAGDDGEDDADRPVTAAPGEWGSRRLCPDGACIGVIGFDGRCRVCGRAASASADAEAKAAPVNGASAADATTARPARVRCPDSACSGAIGPDGHCDVCGKVAA